MAITALSSLLETAVYSAAVGNSTLWNSVSGRFKHGRPAAGWTTPYVIYTFGPLPGVNTFKESSPRATPVTIFFDVFGLTDFYTEASTVGGYIEDVFNGASLTLSGYQNLVIKLVGEKPVEEQDTGMWHLKLTYSGVACPST